MKSHEARGIGHTFVPFPFQMETRSLDDFEIMRTESILKTQVIFYQESVPPDVHYVSLILANDSRRVSKRTMHPPTYSLRYRCLLLDATADKQGRQKGVEGKGRGPF